MRKIFTLFFTLLAVAFTVSAQSPFEGMPGYELIKQNPLRAGNVLHCYEPVDTVDTPAPAGYEPFYISHIGRHGSRYYHRKGGFDSVVDSLQKYSDAGLLTEDGEELLSLAKALQSGLEANVGELTSRGAMEHRQIAARMYRRFPEVFRNNKDIVCANTPSKRVIASRDNFVAQLSSMDPALGFRYFSPAGSVSSKLKVSDEQKEETSRNSKGLHREVRKVTSQLSMDRLMAKTFKNPESIEMKDKAGFFRKIYNSLTIRQCQGEDCNLPYVEDYFTVDEIYSFWYATNADRFNSWCISEENGGYFVKTRTPLLKNLVAQADSCLAGGNRAADLRFSHDTYVQPLAALIGYTGNDYRGTAALAGEHYLAFQSVCMGCNIQFIFYRNRKGNVLVKILHNEKEQTIPSLKKVSKVYHKWPELRKYLLKKAGE